MERQFNACQIPRSIYFRGRPNFGFGFGAETARSAVSASVSVSVTVAKPRQSFGFGRNLTPGETGLRASDVLVLACIKYKPGLYQHRAVGYTGEAASAVDVYIVARTLLHCGATPSHSAAVTQPRQPVLWYHTSNETFLTVQCSFFTLR